MCVRVGGEVTWDASLRRQQCVRLTNMPTQHWPNIKAPNRVVAFYVVNDGPHTIKSQFHDESAVLCAGATGVRAVLGRLCRRTRYIRCSGSLGCCAPVRAPRGNRPLAVLAVLAVRSDVRA